MTAPAVGVTSTQNAKPLISLDMFKFWRQAGVSLKLVPNGTDADNDAALWQIICNASDWAHGVNGLCLQALNATVDTVRDHVNVNRRGQAVIHPRYRPVLAVTAVSIGSSPQTLQALSSLSGVDVQENSFSVPIGPTFPYMSSQGPLQFAGVSAPMDQALVQYSYVNGWPVTWLTDSVAAGALEIPVDDTTGIVEGVTHLTIYAGPRSFRFLAGAVSGSSGGIGLGGAGTVVCPALPFAVPNRAAYPTYVSALPGNAQEAVRLAVRSAIKSSSVGNVSSGSTAKGGAQTSKDPLGAGADLLAAEKLLVDGSFVVPVA